MDFADFIVECMDGLLANARAGSKEPQHFLVPETNWQRLVEHRSETVVPDPPSFRGVPVEFGAHTEQMVAALYDMDGGMIFEEDRK